MAELNPLLTSDYQTVATGPGAVTMAPRQGNVAFWTLREEAGLASSTLAGIPFSAAISFDLTSGQSLQVKGDTALSVVGLSSVIGV